MTDRLIITFNDDLTVSVEVDCAREPRKTHTEIVDLGPNPTWPSPAEAHDSIAEAVKVVLDRWYYDLTGTKVKRNG